MGPGRNHQPQNHPLVFLTPSSPRAAKGPHRLGPASLTLASCGGASRSLGVSGPPCDFHEERAGGGRWQREAATGVGSGTPRGGGRRKWGGLGGGGGGAGSGRGPGPGVGQPGRHAAAARAGTAGSPRGGAGGRRPAGAGAGMRVAGQRR